MRYIIDTTDNGYILSAKILPEIHAGKFVYSDLQSVFEKVEQLETEQGRTA